jgi:hypothetical protein
MRDVLLIGIAALLNLVLAYVAFYVALPADDKNKRRRLLLVFFAASGLALVIAVVIAYRGTEAQTNLNQKVEHVGYGLGYLRTNTDYLVTVLSTLLAHDNKSAANQAASQAESHRKIVAAGGNRQEVAKLEAQRAKEQKQDADDSRKLAIALLPELVRHMQDAKDRIDNEAAHLYDVSGPLTARPTPETEKQLQAAKDFLLHRTEEYRIEMKQMIIAADNIRQKLLQGMDQTDEDKAEEKEFSDAVHGDTDAVGFNVVKATKYLEGLATRAH